MEPPEVPPAGRALWADITRAYVAIPTGLAVGLALVLTLRRFDLLSLLGTVYVAPGVLLTVFLGLGTPSKTLMLARLTGALVGWIGLLSFLSSPVVYSVALFIILTGLVTGYLLLAYLVGAVVALGMTAGNYAWLKLTGTGKPGSGYRRRYGPPSQPRVRPLRRATAAPLFGVLAALGLAVTILALPAVRWYPPSPAAALLVVASTLTAVLALRLRARGSSLFRSGLVMGVTTEGVAVGIFGFGALYLWWSGLIFFPPAFLLASAIAVFGAEKVRTGSWRFVVVGAKSSLLFLFLPALGLLLYALLGNLGDLRWSLAFVAALFGLLSFFAMLGLLLAFLGKPSGRRVARRNPGTT